MKTITPALVREFFRYDPATGWLVWLKKASDKTVVGKRAGWQRSKGGYRQVGFMGQIVYEHRLIWLIVTGSFPEHQIDHRNGVKDDNRFANLRAADSTQNLANIGVKSDNTSGAKNVHWCNIKKRWIAKLKSNGKTKYVGAFRDYNVAVASVSEVRLQVHGEFASQIGCDFRPALQGGNHA